MMMYCSDSVRRSRTHSCAGFLRRVTGNFSNPSRSVKDQISTYVECCITVMHRKWTRRFGIDMCTVMLLKGTRILGTGMYTV